MVLIKYGRPSFYVDFISIKMLKKHNNKNNKWKKIVPESAFK